MTTGLVLPQSAQGPGDEIEQVEGARLNPVTGAELPDWAIPILQQSYVAGFFGDRGSGKSAVMAYYGIAESDRGRPIFYYPEDFGLLGVEAEPMGPEELVSFPDRLNGATVLIDEIQEVLSKFRTNSTGSQLLMAFFRQVRKRGTNVIFTSNDPGGINGALANQTDIHGMCNMLSDKRCYRAGYHLRSCKDTVRVILKDTQGKHGLTEGRKDGRKGFVQHVAGIGDVYRWYNTRAIADPAAVMGMSKNGIFATRAQAELGMSYDDFEKQLRDVIIPQLVMDGWESLAPSNFVQKLKEDLDLPPKENTGNKTLDPRILGRRLTNIGLTSSRKAKGMIYDLPPLEYLTAWQDGVWSPDY